MKKNQGSSIRRSQRTRKTTNQTSRGRSIIPHPPPIVNFAITHSVRLRYTCGTAVTNGAITFQNLLDTVCIATTATAPFDLFRFVRVDRISVWMIDALGTPRTVGVTFNGITAGSQGDQLVHTDTSMGIEPAYLNVRPSRKALCSDYQVSSGSTAFTISCAIGTVIDLSLSFKGSASADAQAAQNASSGATVGATFFRSFDGRATATAQFLLPLGISQF